MNLQRLLDHHKYDMYYQGDAKRDTIDALETIQDLELQNEDMKDNNREAINSLPDEDFFNDLMDALICAKDAKTKAEKQEYIEEALAIAYGLQSELNNTSEHIADLLKGE